MKRLSIISIIVIALMFVVFSTAVNAGWKEEAIIVAQIFQYIENLYLYNVDLTKCRYEIIKKMSPVITVSEEEKTACLDHYSHFETPEETKLITAEFEGHFGGIGVVMKEENGKILIVQFLSDSPAEKSGIKIGDVILKVREENETEGVEVKNSRQVVKRIRGAIDTKVFLTIDRSGQTLEIPIVRGDIKITSVEQKEFGAIGYVRIKEFGEKTADELEDALLAFQKSGKDRVIIDLRNNPGGLLDAAKEMLYYFGKNDDDIMLTMRFKNSEEILKIKDFAGKFVYPKTMKIKLPGEFNNLKIVILINESSASASEVFSGTMKDWGYPVLGVKSFGKGVGQSRFHLIDGSTMTLTTFEFLVGNNKVKIQEIGVTPNVEVKWEKGQGQAAADSFKEYANAFGDPKKDPQLIKAIEFIEKNK